MLKNDAEELGEIEERLRSDIESIVRIFRDRVTRVGGRDIKIVDREGEARAILGGIAGIDRSLSYHATVLYGPKGCGKTTLFNSLVETIHIANKRKDTRTLFDAIVISYEYREEAEKILSVVTSIKWTEGMGGFIKDTLKSVSKAVLKTVRPTVSLPGVVTISIDPFTIASIIIDTVRDQKNLRRNGRLLIVIDEVRASSEQALGSFRDWLEVLANKVREADAVYDRALGGRLSVVILTSDAAATNIWDMVGTKVRWAFMWNLPRDAFEKLTDQLGISVNRDLLWRLVGGNPRELRLIKKAGLERWLEDIIRDRVVRVLTRYWEREPEQTRRAVREVAENPDRLAAWGKPYTPPLEDIFLERNIAIRITGFPGSIAELPKEPWVGEMYAYQIPAYYYTLKAIARKGDLKITPEEVIEETRKI